MKKLFSMILCLTMLFGMVPAVPAVYAAEETVVCPVTIADAYTGQGYVWYNGNGYTATDGMYIQVVEEGADDVGALHIYQTDGVAAAEDMRLFLSIEEIPDGTYTLQYNIKGSDLGITTLNDSCRFYLNNDSDATTQFRNLAGNKTLSQWTTLSETVTAENGSGLFVLGISKYVSGIDCYVDNVKLLDDSGNDLLKGAGNFCVEKTVDTAYKAATIAPSAPDSNYVWFNGNGYTVSGDMYIEIVSEGAEDVGAVHIYQTDGVVAAEDMRVHLKTDGIPVGTYTLKYNIKGSDLGITTLNDACRFYLNEEPDITTQFRNLAGAKTVSEWTALSETITTSEVSDYVVLGISKYVSGINCYVDNVKLLDENGNDLLKGAGNFCVAVTEEPEVTEPEATEPTEPPEIGETIPATLYGSEPEEFYQWYNGNGYAATDHMYIEIAADGANDVGSIHVYQTDGVTGTEDMRINLQTKEIPAGTYTLKYNIKGTDLGNTDTANANKFYVSGNADPFLQFRNVAGVKSLTDWTECSYEVTTTANASMFVLKVSKYVNGADYYIDNVQLLDADGNDLLCGAGNFCTVYEGEPEPLEGVMTLDASAMASAYEAPKYVWTPMYPSGSPDSTTWPAWDDTHYGEIADAGYRDRGSLHLRSVSYKNTGVAIGLDMVVGESYTLGLWAKGNTNSGKVLGLYSNGDLAIIAASTALTSDWSYYECTFTATIPQLNIVATDWGNTNIYLDNITLLDSSGTDLLDGYGDFCTEEYRIADSVSLLDFNDVAESDLISVSGQASVEGASDPTLTLNTEEAETGNAMQATWSYDGINPSYLHRYTANRNSWVATFNEKADDYRYLRMWISNPSHVSVDVSVLLTGEDTVNYFDASAMKLIRRDGTEVYGSTNNNSGYGDNSAISVPKQFAGWLSIPLDVTGLLAAGDNSTVISDFVNVTDIQLEFRKIATTGEGDSSEYYYCVDDICLGRDITGKTQSTQDSNSYADYDTSVKGEGQVKNIIFMIGDGMGYGALEVARLTRPTLYMDTIESLGGVVGAVQTTNLYGDITDSAAAGTALATGYLTKNTVLGLTENLEPVMNLGEYMKQLGKKLGLVTTTYVLDATPAAFAAHTSARGNFTSIALDILSLGVDVVQGGGRSYMTAKVVDENNTAMTLTELAQSQYGYTYATTADEMNAVTSGKLWGLYQDGNMSYVKENSATDPTLAEMTAKTFQLLENEDGFFTMIEGSQIDLAGHANSEIDTRLETLAFDDAIKVAMDYVDANPGTLLIITADHETGGISVAEDGTVSYSSTSHTDELVPYYAYGTGAEYFKDLSVNIELNYAIRQATIGDVSVGASTVAADAQLTATEDMTVVNENGIITYTGVEQPVSFSIPEATAAYAVVRYKTDEANLVGAMDEAKIQYAGDGKWHISDILTLTAGDTHTFQPMSYIKGETYNSIEIAGMSVQIDWVGFFDSYEQAAAFQAHAALTGATPTALNGLSMTLSDDLDMHFYVAADETNLENTTVSLTVGEEKLVSKPGQLDEATGNYKFSIDLAAAQMTDTVTFQLAIGDTVIETGSYSVRQYADAILAGDYDDTTKALVTQMLGYGAAAQTYFAYQTDTLANAGITGAGEQAVPETSQGMAVTDTSDSLNFYGASLVFRSRIAVRFYFDGDSTGCSFAANGQTLTAVEKDGKYCVEIDGIVLQALDGQIKLTVTDATGDTLIVVYSPMDYIVRMSQKGSDSLKALLRAMYNYHLAAKSYSQI
ncbi:MAG: alkaline phosphatase [Oscillospiraceae bacterium]|nr:alkaline phosphatase [Oscillospiraceae bacterium]